MNESNNNSRCESDKRQELSDDEAGALGEPPHDSDFSESDVSFLDLPWEDVIFRYIMPCLPMQTQFQMRRVSLGFRDLMTLYFSTTKSVNICRIALRMTAGAFDILTRDNNSLQNIVLRNAKDWLTDQILISVLNRNNKLLKLDLTNCSSVSNACLQIMSVKCPNIKDICLRECHWVSREGATVIALNCANLEYLDLTGCWEVNDEAVIMIAISCKKLQFLSLAKIYGLTDYAMSVLAREGTCIKHLNIQGCWRLSDDSLRVLAEYGRSLQALQVRECRDVTEMTLSKLRQRGVKIDVRPPPSLRAMSDMSARVRQRLNVQI